MVRTWTILVVKWKNSIQKISQIIAEIFFIFFTFSKSGFWCYLLGIPREFWGQNQDLYIKID